VLCRARCCTGLRRSRAIDARARGMPFAREAMSPSQACNAHEARAFSSLIVTTTDRTERRFPCRLASRWSRRSARLVRSARSRACSSPSGGRRAAHLSCIATTPAGLARRVEARRRRRSRPSRRERSGRGEGAARSPAAATRWCATRAPNCANTCPAAKAGACARQAPSARAPLRRVVDDDCDGLGAGAWFTQTSAPVRGCLRGQSRQAE
jgi:hypothetical protein